MKLKHTIYIVILMLLSASSCYAICGLDTVVENELSDIENRMDLAGLGYHVYEMYEIIEGYDNNIEHYRPIFSDILLNCQINDDELDIFIAIMSIISISRDNHYINLVGSLQGKPYEADYIKKTINDYISFYNFMITNDTAKHLDYLLNRLREAPGDSQIVYISTFLGEEDKVIPILLDKFNHVELSDGANGEYLSTALTMMVTYDMKMTLSVLKRYIDDVSDAKKRDKLNRSVRDYVRYAIINRIEYWVHILGLPHKKRSRVRLRNGP